MLPEFKAGGMVAFEDLDLPAVVAMPSWSQSFSARPLAVAVTDRLSRIRTNYDTVSKLGSAPVPSVRSEYAAPKSSAGLRPPDLTRRGCRRRRRCQTSWSRMVGSIGQDSCHACRPRVLRFFKSEGLMSGWVAVR